VPLQAGEIVLHTFTGGTGGANPGVGLCSGPAGKLYGSAGGGAAGAGVVFYLHGTGSETVVHSFTGGADGAFPTNVICKSTGNVYGATVFGGAANAGVVFRLEGQDETVLYSFTGGADGGFPFAGVIQDAAGNLYGTTGDGGLPSGLCIATNGCGVVFKLDPTGHETVLYAFTGGADGWEPSGGSLIQDAAGNLYGTTSHGGAFGQGVVFKLDPTGHETVLYNFTGGADGAGPSSVILDSAGNLYGTTGSGGLFSSNCGDLETYPFGCGVVFKLDPTGHETVLYTFTGGADGSAPNLGLIRDSAGNLYGTTIYGGNAEGFAGAGVVYEITPGDAIAHDDNISPPSP
jgi:uncharacterized repeat protein (TIGR03803 family)